MNTCGVSGLQLSKCLHFHRFKLYSHFYINKVLTPLISVSLYDMLISLTTNKFYHNQICHCCSATGFRDSWGRVDWQRGTGLFSVTAWFQILVVGGVVRPDWAETYGWYPRTTGVCRIPARRHSIESIMYFHGEINVTNLQSTKISSSAHTVLFVNICCGPL